MPILAQLAIGSMQTPATTSDLGVRGNSASELDLKSLSSQERFRFWIGYMGAERESRSNTVANCGSVG